jgi:hypothetical protein
MRPKALILDFVPCERHIHSPDALRTLNSALMEEVSLGLKTRCEVFETASLVVTRMPLLLIEPQLMFQPRHESPPITAMSLEPKGNVSS